MLLTSSQLAYIGPYSSMFTFKIAFNYYSISYFFFLFCSEGGGGNSSSISLERLPFLFSIFLIYYLILFSSKKLAAALYVELSTADH